VVSLLIITVGRRQRCYVL